MTSPAPRRHFVRLTASALGALTLLAAAPWAHAAEESPDAMIQRLSDDLLQTIRADKTLQTGDVDRLMAVVDSKVMPNVNFTRMTASATGPSWRKATPDQRQRLQQEFKNLLVRTYAGALKQVSDQSVEVKPLRAAPNDKEVIVRTLVKSKGDPVQLDYRLERTPGQGSGWKIYDL
ncbi:MAG TPA: ABC transporter substrate-binding protein, partial [Ottowia sp.]|nr:ABC transporter substrate-binding protein [Ottowia sp.]